MRNKLFTIQTRILILVILVVFVSSCEDHDNDINHSIQGELNLEFAKVENGEESSKHRLILHDFTETKSYKIWESSNSVWLDYRLNFKGQTEDETEYTGYLQFASVEEDQNKLILTNNTWEYVNSSDMLNFLKDDMVIVINEAGFNDRNDNEAIRNIELSNQIFYINRSFSGQAWLPYMDGTKGYNILNASFNGYIGQ